MDEEKISAPNLWVHEERAIISAESHYVWSFTPEFLVSNEIVPTDWACTRVTQNQGTVDIQYGPTDWRMNESFLWITTSPDCPWREDPQPEDSHIVPVMASKFLEAVPLLPSRRFWFSWQVSAVKSNPRQWMSDNFLPRKWPTGLEPEISRISFNLFEDNLVLQMNISIESKQRLNQPIQDLIIFDCHASRGLDQYVNDMVLATDHWTEWLGAVERVIRHLLEGGNSQ